MKTLLKTVRKDNYPLLLLIPILVYYILGLTDSWIPSADSAVYISLGRSLITGDGYTYMGSTQVRFPFLYPLILAPIIGVFGKNFLLMRLVSIMMGVGSLGLVYLLFKRVCEPRWGLVLMFLTGANGYYYFFCHHILSDITYTFFSLFALWYFTKKQEQSRSVFVLAGLLLAAYFTRTVGVILLAAVLVYRLVEIRGKSAQTIILVLIFLLPVGLWSYRSRTVSVKDQTPANLGESANYFDEFFSRNLSDKEKEYIGINDIGRRILRNSRYYREIATILIVPYSFSFAQENRLIPVLLVVGFIGCWFKNRTLIEYYVFLYVLAYMLWPTFQGVRFYVPIFCFLLYYLFSGVGFIVDAAGRWLKFSDRIKKRLRPAITTFLVIFLLGIHLQASWGTVDYLRRKGYYRKSVNNFFSSIQWVTDNTGTENIFIADRAPWVYLLSERKTHGFARVDDSAEVLKSILRKYPDYIITSSVTGYSHYLDIVLADYPHMFTEVYRQEDSAVYRVVPGAEG
jgi:4-amino-4-deoxy-L-arabinose transferase-like glycosyltransferase